MFPTKHDEVEIKEFEPRLKYARNRSARPRES